MRKFLLIFLLIYVGCVVGGVILIKNAYKVPDWVYDTSDTLNTQEEAGEFFLQANLPGVIVVDITFLGEPTSYPTEVKFKLISKDRLNNFTWGKEHTEPSDGLGGGIILITLPLALVGGIIMGQKS